MLKPHKSGGFTLVEIMISILLLSVVISVLSGGFNLSIRSWEAGAEKMENHYSVTEAVSLISRQIKTARKVYQYGETFGERRLAFHGTSVSAVFVTSSPRLADNDLAGGLYVQKIYYDPAKKRLSFEEFPFDSFSPIEESQGESFSLSEERIGSFALEYYVLNPDFNGDDSEPEYQWVSSYNPLIEEAPIEGEPQNDEERGPVYELPVAVRLNLKIEKADSKAFVWPEMIIPLYQNMELLLPPEPEEA